MHSARAVTSDFVVRSFFPKPNVNEVKQRMAPGKAGCEKTEVRIGFHPTVLDASFCQTLEVGIGMDFNVGVVGV